MSGARWMALALPLLVWGCDRVSGTACADCPADQLCWTTTDFDGSVLNGCMDWPEACSEEQTCECVNDNSATCNELGWEQNSEACTVIDDREVLSCVSTLG